MSSEVGPPKKRRGAGLAADSPKLRPSLVKRCQILRVDEAKNRLPLPALLHREGLGDHAKKSALCPLHDDEHKSFSVFKGKDGSWHWKCFAGCGGGDEITFLEKRENISRSDATKRFIQMAGGSNGAAPNAPQLSREKRVMFDWQKCVDAFTDDHLEHLGEWRGLRGGFTSWLHKRGDVGLCKNRVAFPVREKQGVGRVLAAHYCRPDLHKFFYFPEGVNTQPFVIGDPSTTKQIHLFESQWDMFAFADRTELYLEPSVAFVCTRGAENAKLVQGLFHEGVSVCAWPQNDGHGMKWLSDLPKYSAVPIAKAITPAPHKDVNDWCRAGATVEDIYSAFFRNELVEVPKLPESEILPEETADTLAESEIRGEIVGILTDRKLLATEQRTAIADAVVLALIARGQFFFHAERRDFESAMFFDQKRKRLERIRSDAFLAWLSDWLRVNRADVLFKYIIAEVETVALSEKNSKAIVPEKFWASRTGAVYLSNGAGAMVRITATKIEIVHNGSDEVLFAAGDTLRPWNLTEPRDPFNECSVFSKATYAAKHGRDLLKIWAISLPTNPASKPPLCAVGPIGSGKTRMASAVAELYGIPALTNNVEDFGEDSFWANIDAGGLFTLDNCDTRTKWLPDAVASAATAGCSQRRKKYTDSETITLRARAALCLTTANPTFASDAGLADRLLVLRMNRRTDETSDARLSQEVADHRDAGLSFISRVLCRALADKEATPGGLNQRHPDFAAFCVRIGRAIGRKDEVVKALKAAEQDKSLLCIETDFVGSALLEYLENKESFNGTATELRDELIRADSELEDKLSAKRLGKRLDMVWPHLEKVFRAEKEKDSHTRKTTYLFKSAQCA
jgi:hypothetical protein